MLELRRRIIRRRIGIRAFIAMFICGVLLGSMMGCRTVATSLSPFSAKEVQEMRRTSDAHVKLDPMSAFTARLYYHMTKRRGLAYKRMEALADWDGLVLGRSWGNARMEKRYIRGYEKGNIPIYICYPNAQDKDDYERIIFFIHGGSFTSGGIATYAPLLQDLAKSMHAIVVSPMYHLAPSIKWPGQPYEVLAAYRWMLGQMGKPTALPRWMDTKRAIKIPQANKPVWRDVPIYSMGDSAGGNLASVLALMCYDYGLTQVDAQVLYYPVELLLDRPTATRELFTGKKGGHYILEQNQVELSGKAYFNNPEDGNSRYASPLLAELPKLHPPVLFVAAEVDPLRDDSVLMHDKLKKLGVYTELVVIKGTIHGFMSIPWIGRNDDGVDYTKAFIQKIEAQAALNASSEAK